MADASNQMMRILANEFDEIRELYDEHVEFYEELLPHVLMGDIASKIAEPEVKARRMDEGSLIRRLIDRLESFWAAETADDQSMSNVIAVSFLENFRNLEKLQPLLGPNMKGLVDRYLIQRKGLIKRPDGIWKRNKK